MAPRPSASAGPAPRPASDLTARPACAGERRGQAGTAPRAPRGAALRGALLAGALLSAGCLIETGADLGGVDLYWSEWHSELLGDFGGYTSDAVCPVAGVDAIEITLVDPAGDVREPVTRSCTTPNGAAGIAFRDLEAGDWQYGVAAYRGGELVFSDPPPGDPWPSFSVENGETTVADARLVARYFDLQVDYQAEGCPSGGRIDFDLYATGDLENPVYSTRNGPNPPVTVPCDVLPKAWVIPSVPGGTCAFGEWIQYDADGTEVGWSDCSPTWPQSSLASSTVSVDLVSVPTGGYCPPP